MKTPDQYTTYLERNLITTMPNVSESLWAFIDERQYGDFHLRKGSMDMLIDDNTIEYEWTLPGDIAISLLPRMGLRDIQQHPLDWRQLKKAIITNQQSGATLNILERLPEGCDIYFPVVPRPEGVNFYSVLDNVIRLNEAIDGPSGVFVLAHEVTHAEQSLEEYHTRLDRTIGMIALKAILDRRFGDKQHATLLKKEKDTWAGALSMLEPFISEDPNATFNRATLEAYVHLNLATNSHNIIKERGQ